MFLSRADRDNFSRKYLSAERAIRTKENANAKDEIKATTISNKSKVKLFRSMNQIEKFGIVIRQFYLRDELYADKKTKQRYLDWAYKMAVKHKFEVLIEDGRIIPDQVERLHFYVDEHSTATNGKYELRESLLQEFKVGSFDPTWINYHLPLFSRLQDVDVQFCDSKSTTLVRAADIVANKIYHMAVTGDYREASGRNLHMNSHPPLKEISIL